MRDVSPEPGPGRRTSAAVREAALTLFAERGYELTTMRHLAEAVGIQAASLYNHIPSKQALLVEITHGTMDALLRGLREAKRRAGPDPADRLVAATEAHVRFHCEHRREAFIGNREISSLEPGPRQELLDKRRRYEHGFRRLIQDGVRAGRFSVRSPKLTSFAILEMGIGVATWFREGGPLSVDEVAAVHGELALRMVGAAPSR